MIERYALINEYGFRHLPTHLARREYFEKLHDLLLDFEWMQAKLEVTNVRAVTADYELNQNGQSVPKDVIRMHQFFKKYGYIIQNDLSQLPAQIYGFLCGEKSISINSLLRQIETQSKLPWLKPILPWPESSNLSGIVREHQDAVVRLEVASIMGEATLFSLSNKGQLARHGLNKLDARPLHVPDGQVTSFAIDVEGKQMFYAHQSDGHYYISSLDLEKEVKGPTWECHSSPIRWLIVDSNNRYLISASKDQIQIWSIENRTLQRESPSNWSEIQTLCYSPENRILYVGFTKGWPLKWEIRDEPRLPSYLPMDDAKARLPSAGISAIAASPDGRYLFFAEIRQLYCWDLLASRVAFSHIIQIEGNNERINNIVFLSQQSENSVQKFNLAISSGLGVFVIQVSNQELGITWSEYSGHVEVMVSILEQQQLIAGSLGGEIRVWELKNNSKDRSTGFERFNNRLLSKDPGETFLLAVSDHTIWNWSLSQLKSQAKKMDWEEEITAICILDEKLAIIGSRSGKIYRYDIDQGNWNHAANLEDSISALCVTPNSLMVGMSSGEIATYSLPDLKRITAWKAHDVQIDSISWLATSNRLICSSKSSSKISFWKITPEPKEELSITEACIGISSLAVDENEKFIATGCLDRLIRIWSLDRLGTSTKLKHHKKPVQSVGWIKTNSSLLLCSGSMDGDIFVCDPWKEKLATFTTGRKIDKIVTLDNNMAVWALDMEGLLMAFHFHFS